MSTSKPGRPRSERTRSAILSAAFEILAEHGYSGMSIEKVAKAAGAGKTTVYRWWDNRADLAVDAFFVATGDELQLGETENAAEDFKTQILSLAKLLQGERGAVFAAMLGGTRTDPELAKAMGDRWLVPRRRWGQERLASAIKAGQCHAGIDLHSALGILYGSLYAPLLFGQTFPSEEQVKAHLKLALPTIFKDKN